MKRAACAVLSLLLWACGPDALPAPTIVSVVPERVPQGDVSALSVKVNAVLPFSVDYDSQSAESSPLPMTVELGGQAVDVPFAEEDGTLVVPVPEGLAVGSYDIRVALTDGRDTERDDAFTVVPPSTLTGTPDEGTLPSLDALVGFQLEPIGEQVRGVPFQIRLRATGPGALTFHESVSLRVSHGQVVSVTRGTFKEGVFTQEISISNPGPRLYLLVEDAQGHRGLSNPFRVWPH
jgi:hypothetical protein